MIPLLGPILTALVPTIARQVVDSLVANPKVPVTQTQAPVTQAAVEDAVAHALRKDVGPMLENATNQEPKIQSRVLQGSVLGFLVSVASLFLEWHNGDLDMNEMVTHGTVILGTLWAIYGRLRSGLKPVGS